MTPAERANLEYTYDRLLDLQDSGQIRPLELEQMQQISQQLMPMWQNEQLALRPSEPTLDARDTSTQEDVANWWGDKIQRVSGDTPWPMDQYSSYDMGRKISDLMTMLPLTGGMMAGNQAGRDVSAGNYGSAALNAAGAAADFAPLGFAARGGSGSLRRGLLARSEDDAANAYRVSGGLTATPAQRTPLGQPAIVSIPDQTGARSEWSARPIAELRDAARMTAKQRRGLLDIEGDFPSLDQNRSRLIAAAYDAAPHAPSDPMVRQSYDAMIQETLDQYNRAKNAGIDIKFIPEGMKDPYAASPAMGYRDLMENGRLWVFPTDQGFGTGAMDVADNPLLKSVGRIGDKENAVANDAFRAVHDLYGHYGSGNPFFRSQGEERAWLEHQKMYSPEALNAMTAETRGQNSWVNYGPHGSFNRTASGESTIYAPQKAARMPAWVTDPTGMPSDDEIQRLYAQIAGWKQ